MNFRLILCLLYCLIIMALCLMPGSAVPSVPVKDKIIHGAIFIILGLLLMWWQMSIPGSRHKKALYNSVLMGVLFGLLVELSQHFSPGRSVELLDLAANMGGVLAGALGFLLFHVVIYCDEET